MTDTPSSTAAKLRNSATAYRQVLLRYAQQEDRVIRCHLCIDHGYIYGNATRPDGPPDTAWKCPKCHGHQDSKLLLQQANIPKAFLKCTVASFETKGSEHLRNIRRQVADYLRYYHDGTGLFFRGPVGVGKTHLAVAVLKELCRRNIPCSFLDTSGWLEDLKASIAEDEELDTHITVEHARRVHVLLLDDLGAERSTEFSRDTIYTVISTRHQNKLTTLVTTNVEKEQLIREQGHRLWSRLTEMCKTVSISSHDHRTHSQSPLPLTGEPRDWHEE